MHGADDELRERPRECLDHGADDEQQRREQHEQATPLELVAEKAAEQRAAGGRQHAEHADGRDDACDLAHRQVQSLGVEERAERGVEVQADEEDETAEPVPREVRVLPHVEPVARDDRLQRHVGPTLEFLRAALGLEEREQRKQHGTDDARDHEDQEGVRRDRVGDADADDGRDLRHQSSERRDLPTLLLGELVGLKGLDGGAGDRPARHAEHPAGAHDEQVRGEADDDESGEADGAAEEDEGRAPAETGAGPVAPDADDRADQEVHELRGARDVAEHLLVPRSQFGDPHRDAVRERHHHRHRRAEAGDHEPEDVAPAHRLLRLADGRRSVRRSRRRWIGLPASRRSAAAMPTGALNSSASGPFVVTMTPSSWLCSRPRRHERWTAASTRQPGK